MENYRKYFLKSLLFTFGYKLFLIAIGNIFPGGWNGWQHVLDVLSRNDSGWYHLIAREWYPQVSSAGVTDGAYAFFPLYPVFVRAFLLLTQDYIMGTFILHLITTYIWVRVLFVYLTKSDFSPQKAFIFIVLYQSFPFHYIFHALYSEQLFSILLLWSLIEIKGKRWYFLFLSTFLLALCRPTGLMMAVGMGFIYLEGNGWFKLFCTWKKSKMFLSLSGAIAGIALWSFYLKQYCGNAFAFSSAQANWGRHYTWPWESFFKSGMWDMQLLSIYIIILFILTIIAMRKAKVGDKLFVALNAVFPLTTGSVLSMQRFFSVFVIAFQYLFARFYSNWILWAVILSLLNLLTFFYWVGFTGILAC